LNCICRSFQRYLLLLLVLLYKLHICYKWYKINCMRGEMSEWEKKWKKKFATHSTYLGINEIPKIVHVNSTIRVYSSSLSYNEHLLH